MSRIDEIKGRLRARYFTIERTFEVPPGFDGGMVRFIDNNQKDRDIEYLLDRIAKLENAVDAARIYSSPNCGCPLCEALAALDNDDEKETS